MMYCSRCGTNNREGSKFCNNCGAQLTSASTVTCPVCGTVNPVENAFCNNCRARLAPQAATPQDQAQPGTPIKGLSLPIKAQSAPSESSLPSTDHPIDRSEQKSERQGDIPPGEELPGWLARLREIPPEEEKPSSAPALSRDAPDWVRQLQSLRPEEPSTEAGPTEWEFTEPPSVAEESGARESRDFAREQGSREPEQDEIPRVPEWDQAARELERDQAARELERDQGSRDLERDWTAPSSETPELPSWAVPPPSGEKSETPADRSGFESAEEAFDWRAAEEQIESLGEPPLTGPVPAAQQPSERVAPELADQAPPPWAEIPPAAEAAVPTTEESSRPSVPDSVMPSWMQGLGTGEDESAEQHAAQEAQSKAELPDWLIDSTGGQQPNINELPDWLRMAMPAQKPAELPTEPAPPSPSNEPVTEVVTTPKRKQAKRPPAVEDLAAEPLQAGNPLAGLRGLLPLAVAVAEPHAYTEIAALSTTKADKDEGARLFQAILAEGPPEAEPIPEKSATRRWTAQPFIYLALLISVLLAFLLPSSLASALLPISRTPAASFYDLIQQVPPNSTVLVAFDYDPGVASEMDLQARTVVRHLMQRRVNIIALSTLEAGPQIAQTILSSTAVQVGNYSYGAQYINLGYLPGHEVGVAQLATNGISVFSRDYAQGRDLRQYPVTQAINGIRDLKLVVEFTGTEEALRMWMEQFQPRTQLPFAAGVSAAVEPKAKVYLRPGQLVGLIGGLTGAAQYEVLSSQPGQALTSVNAQCAAQIVLVLLVVLGSFVHLVSRRRGRETLTQQGTTA